MLILDNHSYTLAFGWLKGNNNASIKKEMVKPWLCQYCRFSWIQIGIQDFKSQMKYLFSLKLGTGMDIENFRMRFIL
jgi:hypothetical protein